MGLFDSLFGRKNVPVEEPPEEKLNALLEQIQTAKQSLDYVRSQIEVAEKRLAETQHQRDNLFLEIKTSALDEVKNEISKLEKELKKADEPFRSKIIEEMDILRDKIAQGHNYRYIGRIGLFTPVISGAGGGILVREGKDKDGNVKYDSASGAKGYRWLESETVKELKLEKKVDRSFYDAQVNAAVETISQFGDFEWFAS